MSHYFSRITLATEDADAVRQIAKDCYCDHQHIWRLFADDPDARRDFIFRRERIGAQLNYYIVSSRQPVDRAGIWNVETKPDAPQLRRGQVLGFKLRVNPVITRTDASGKSHRHDVVMDAKKRIDSRAMPTVLSEIVQQAGREWLLARAEKHGFKLSEESLLVDGYQQQVGFKKSAKHPIRYSTLDYSGLLTVTDSERFVALLRDGVGPAKSFGCGLMLVRRM